MYEVEGGKERRERRDRHRRLGRGKEKVRDRTRLVWGKEPIILL